MGMRQRLEQPRGPQIPHADPLTAGGLAQGAGEVALPGPGRPEDEQIEGSSDPVALDEAEDAPTVQTASRREVEILDGGRLLQVRGPQPSGQPGVLAALPFAVHKQTQPVLEGQLRIVGRDGLLFETLTEAWQTQGRESIQEWLL